MQLGALYGNKLSGSYNDRSGICNTQINKVINRLNNLFVPFGLKDDFHVIENALIIRLDRHNILETNAAYFTNKPYTINKLINKLKNDTTTKKVFTIVIFEKRHHNGNISSHAVLVQIDRQISNNIHNIHLHFIDGNGHDIGNLTKNSNIYSYFYVYLADNSINERYPENPLYSLLNHTLRSILSANNINVTSVSTTNKALSYKPLYNNPLPSGLCFERIILFIVTTVYLYIRTLNPPTVNNVMKRLPAIMGHSQNQNNIRLYKSMLNIVTTNFNVHSRTS